MANPPEAKPATRKAWRFRFTLSEILLFTLTVALLVAWWKAYQPNHEPLLATTFAEDYYPGTDLDELIGTPFMFDQGTGSDDIHVYPRQYGNTWIVEYRPENEHPFDRGILRRMHGRVVAELESLGYEVTAGRVWKEHADPGYVIRYRTPKTVGLVSVEYYETQPDVATILFRADEAPR